ncbi:MAG: hypothetical protein RTU09_09695 [Candidatus Thorarchaeota archaeon]
MSVKLANEANVFSSGHQVSEQFTHHADKPTFESLAASFLRLADLRLSSTQKTVLRMSAQLLEHNCLAVTGLADLLSRRSAVPYSTAKWNLRVLMDLGLLTGGDTQCRGLHASLTPPGRMLAAHLEESDVD